MERRGSEPDLRFGQVLHLLRPRHSSQIATRQESQVNGGLAASNALIGTRPIFGAFCILPTEHGDLVAVRWTRSRLFAHLRNPSSRFCTCIYCYAPSFGRGTCHVRSSCQKKKSATASCRTQCFNAHVTRVNGSTESGYSNRPRQSRRQHALAIHSVAPETAESTCRESELVEDTVRTSWYERRLQRYCLWRAPLLRSSHLSCG